MYCSIRLSLLVSFVATPRASRAFESVVRASLRTDTVTAYHEKARGGLRGLRLPNHYSSHSPSRSSIHTVTFASKLEVGSPVSTSFSLSAPFQTSAEPDELRLYCPLP